MERNLFHITHIRNLPQILDEGGLWCDSECARQRVSPVNIAYADLKVARARTRVPVCKRGTLADYVPFYFAPRSPMLYAIHKGKVEGYQEGQEPVLYLVVRTEAIRQQELPFAFTDGHAATPFSQFFEDWAHLELVDWELMNATYWKNTDEDGDRKRRRQAEFLVHRFLPWDAVREIGVCTEAVRQNVERVLARAPHTPQVNVVPDWYYR
ncbi:type II toxin-antitoxin system toxin DNA ADP-ribosyl transferase DarT [Hyalangium versicolor]|uniref:type II toxin-antitoxin system toxin DNA ADP-ribosyl transferase DarT n=1 Tax=Hyalangium versicolor TaxID=2861190 RepID=UPI001CCDA20E|nr:DUF4433 domain-containing protein [Hyalangium versicolor]